MTFPPTLEQAAILSSARESNASLMISALAGTGKALRNDQRVVTPRGLRAISEIQVGDLVASNDGQFYPVSGVFPQGKKLQFSLKFSDGTYVVTSADHIWTMRRADNKIVNVTTLELGQKCRSNAGNVSWGDGTRAYWFLPMTAPVNYPTTNLLPMDPWFLGILIGDGCLQEKSICFSSADKEIVEKVAAIAAEDFLLNCRKTSDFGYDYRLASPSNLGKENLLLNILRQLQLAGKKSEDKFIPWQYMTAPINDRIAILQGLFDSDGSANGPAVDYVTTSLALAYDVKTLVESLGGTAVLSEKQTTHKVAFRLYVKLPPGIQPFSLSRKTANYNPKQRKPYRALESVTQLKEEAECTCISIQSPTSLFLTENFIVTHNTTTLAMLAEALPPVPSLALAFNVKIKKELEERFPSHFTVLTLNGLGHRAWTRKVGPVTLDDRKLGKILTAVASEWGTSLSQDDWADALRLTSAAMNAGVIPNFFPLKGFVVDSPAIWTSLALDLDVNPDLGELAREVLIESIKQGHGTGGKQIISYDDQIYLPTFFGGAFSPQALVMVDEAQDLSPVQHEMIRKVCPKGRLIVVGDPKQAIYAFRGADSSSMEKLRGLRQDWIDLPLTLTFRCPKVVVERQQEHAPGYTAAESNLDGQVISLLGLEEGWSWDAIPSGQTAVLCRNNAPLLSLALKLLARHIGVVMLGRDIGKGLIALAKKVLPNPELVSASCIPLIADWRDREVSLAKANEKQHKISGIEDRAECLLAVLEHVASAGELQTKLKDLFSRERGQVTLASGHRAKGLEWQHVLHLDPFRIPSRYAKKAAAAGHPGQLEQEYNLRYVIETRAKETLILANLEDFE